MKSIGHPLLGDPVYGPLGVGAKNTSAVENN